MAANNSYILVTGGNKGIGLAICKKILEDHPNFHVLLGSRDHARGTEAVNSLHKEGLTKVSLMELDVTDDGSIDSAVFEYGHSYSTNGSMYGIVNNAGVGFGRSIEDTVDTNTLGPMRVFDKFLPFLQASGRVVNIASASGPNFTNSLTVEQRGFYKAPREPFAINAMIANKTKKSKVSKPGFDNTAYGFSKALLIAHTMFIAQEHPGLIINSCTPGWIATDLTAGMGATDLPFKGTKAALKCLFDCETHGLYYGSDALRSPIDEYREPGAPEYNPPKGSY